jgi:hypothetical protein
MSNIEIAPNFGVRYSTFDIGYSNSNLRSQVDPVNELKRYPTAFDL